MHNSLYCSSKLFATLIITYCTSVTQLFLQTPEEGVHLAKKYTNPLLIVVGKSHNELR